MGQRREMVPMRRRRVACNSNARRREASRGRAVIGDWCFPPCNPQTDGTRTLKWIRLRLNCGSYVGKMVPAKPIGQIQLQVAEGLESPFFCSTFRGPALGTPPRTGSVEGLLLSVYEDWGGGGGCIGIGCPSQPAYCSCCRRATRKAARRSSRADTTRWWAAWKGGGGKDATGPEDAIKAQVGFGRGTQGWGLSGNWICFVGLKSAHLELSPAPFNGRGSKNTKSPKKFCEKN